MKAVFALLFLLVLLPVFLPGNAHAQLDCSSSTCSATVSRTISTTGWGVTLVRDQIVLRTVGASSSSHLVLGLPAGVQDHLQYAVAADSQGSPLRVSRLGLKNSPSGGSYGALDVVFLAPKTGQYTFNLTTVYGGLLTYSQSSSSFSLSINFFPVTDGTFNVTAGIRLSTADWPSPRISPTNQTVSGGAFCAPTPCGSFAPLNAFNTTVWKVTFSSSGTAQNIFDVSAGRVIQISSSGSIQVSDSYNITNRGPVLSSLTFLLPKGILGVSASDIIGPVTITTPTVNLDGTSTLSFTPRFASNQIPTNQSARVLISYQLSPQTYVSTDSIGRFTINFEAFDNVKFLQSSFQTRIVTPVGFKLNTLSGVVAQTSGAQIVIQVSPVTPVSSLGFSMTYQLDPFWSGLSVLGWAGLIEAALAASVIGLWSGPGVAGAVSGVPSQLINRFVELYDEKSSMRLEADKMDEDLNRGALNRYDYKRRRRVIDLRMGEIDRALSSVKEELSNAESRYEDMIKRIERAEAELQVAKATSVDLRNQYRSGKMARDLYDSLVADLARRKERAQQTIDTVVINLREEIR